MAKRKPVAPPKRRKSAPSHEYDKSMFDKAKPNLDKFFGRGKRKPGQRAPGPKRTPGRKRVTPMKKKK